MSQRGNLLSAKLQQIEFRVRQHGKRYVTLARESWVALAAAGCKRVGRDLRLAHVCQNRLEVYAREPLAPYTTKLITTPPRMLPLFRGSSGICRFYRCVRSCFSFFFFFFFTRTAERSSKCVRVRRSRSIRERGVSLLRRACTSRHR